MGHWVQPKEEFLLISLVTTPKKLKFDQSSENMWLLYPHCIIKELEDSHNSRAGPSNLHVLRNKI